MTVIVVNPAGKRREVFVRDADVAEDFVRRLRARGFRQIVIIESPAGDR